MFLQTTDREQKKQCMRQNTLLAKMLLRHHQDKDLPARPHSSRAIGTASLLSEKN